MDLFGLLNTFKRAFHDITTRFYADSILLFADGSKVYCSVNVTTTSEKCENGKHNNEEMKRRNENITYFNYHYNIIMFTEHYSDRFRVNF